MKHLLFCTARIIDENVYLPFSKILAVAHCLLLLSSSVLSFFFFFFTYLVFYVYICDLFLSLSVQIARSRYILSIEPG